MMRFVPARTYLTAAAVALGLTVFCGWWAWSWAWALVPAVVTGALAAGVLWLGLRPTVEIRETEMLVGRRAIEWKSIRRVDQTGWVSPLVADLTLADQSQVRLIYPGETERSNELLRLIQQRSTQALINGVPYKKIFGEQPKAQRNFESPRYQVLTQADEAEVERLYHQLRTAGRIDPEK